MISEEGPRGLSRNWPQVTAILDFLSESVSDSSLERVNENYYENHQSMEWAGIYVPLPLPTFACK